MNNDAIQPIPLSALMDTISGVIVEPYKIFFAKLYAAGRVTDAEVTALRAACETQIAQLSPLVDKALESAARDEVARSRSSNP